MRRSWDRFIAFENVAHALLVRYSVMLLRVAIGATFFAFGVLKYFPGVSPGSRHHPREIQRLASIHRFFDEDSSEARI